MISDTSKTNRQGDYVRSSNFLLTSGTSYTKSAWIYRANDSPAWQNVLTTGDAGGPHALLVRDNNLFVHHRGGAGADVDSHDTGQTVASRQWIHVAVVFDDAANTLTTCYNGQAIDTRTGVGDLGPQFNPKNIGGYGGITSQFAGQVDDVRVCNSALPAEQVNGLAMPV